MARRILIVYESIDGQTASIVERVVGRLGALGHETVVFRGSVIPNVMSPGAFDGVIVAAPVRIGRYPRSIRRFVRAHAVQLDARPSAFLSVSCAAASPQPDEKAEALDRIRAFLVATRWHPWHSLAIGGALMYLKYGAITRWIMKSIAGRAGLDTDTSHNHEYTDWDAVDRFSDAFAEEVSGTSAATETHGVG